MLCYIWVHVYYRVKRGNGETLTWSITCTYMWQNFYQFLCRSKYGILSSVNSVWEGSNSKKGSGMFVCLEVCGSSSKYLWCKKKKKNTPHACTMRGILNDEMYHGKEHWNTIKINLQLWGAYWYFFILLLVMSRNQNNTSKPAFFLCFSSLVVRSSG